MYKNFQNTCFTKCFQVNRSEQVFICDALRNMVPFVQFKNVKITHEGVLLLDFYFLTKFQSKNPEIATTDSGIQFINEYNNQKLGHVYPMCN